jgi:hypothetical protein
MKRIDALVVLLFAVILALVAAAIYAALRFEWFGTPWHFASWLLICLAFVVVGVPTLGNRIAGPANVHGSARLASQDEAKKAAQGKSAASPLHEQIFED